MKTVARGGGGGGGIPNLKTGIGVGVVCVGVGEMGWLQGRPVYNDDTIHRYVGYHINPK